MSAAEPPPVEVPAASGNGTRPKPRGTCRVEDCPNDRNTRYSRGPLSGLCEETHVPARRIELSEAGRKLHADHAVRTRPARRDPEPEPETDDVREATLTELAADLERAERYFADAEEVYEDAVARFLAHSLVRAHVGYLDAATP